MQTCLKRIASGMLSLIGAGILLAGFSTSEARAQDPPYYFNFLYGGSCHDLGRGGVQPVTEGGYIAVGETRSTTAACSEADIYVVRTYDNGHLLWSKSYNLGGNDYALSVREVVCDPSGQGGFIVTGYTENLHSDCGYQRDLFLLRIDRCGEVIWSNTYGTSGWAEIGWDVVEACTNGNPSYGTSQGDFIAAGYTNRTKSGYGRDGYLVRARWSDGALIWDATYDGPNQKDDYFRAVDETWYGNTGTTGDIIAAGGSNSYSSGTFDAWMIRVDGNTGHFTGTNHSAVTYGGSGFEELHSIQELKHSVQRSDIVAAGTSTTLTGGRDVYVLQTRSGLCSLVNDVVFGDLDYRADEANWIREVTFNTAQADQGQVVITGYMTPRAGEGHGASDVFLQTLQAGSLTPSASTAVMLYGGDGADWGWSVSPIWSPFLAERRPHCLSLGYIVAGWNSSPSMIGSDPQQLYLIGTDENLRDGCTNLEYQVDYKDVDFKRDCSYAHVSTIWEYCPAHPEMQCQYWEDRFCLDREETCDIERCECSPAKRSVPIPGEIGQGALSLSSYPNPVKGGSSLTLEYTLAADALVNVTASDMSGRIIYMTSVPASSGTGTLSVGTEGWGSGSYMVSIAANGRIASTRVVVTE